MKTLYITPVLLSLILLINGCSLSIRPEEYQPTSVITADKTILPIGSFTNLLEKSIQTIRSNDKYDNFILFIHGRGKHPEKAFKKALLSNLESNYSAKVIMFNWPSWNGPFSFPEDNARASANDFIKVLRQLEAFQQNNRQLSENIKFTLLTHSMGSLVLEEAVLKMKDKQAKPVFDTLVISSSASAGKKHADWVKQITLSENIYITVNNDDPVLGPAGAKLNGRRLGKGLSNSNNIEFELADNANYIDVTNTGVNHRYYIYPGMKNSTAIKFFFNNTLNGIPAVLDKEHGIIKIERERIYIMKK
ncbi:hypothetical protein MNBD_GAMMA09-3716 [hydrothermal vent metagenome]|uniref:Uncharacterized protein n=1 Tax=hydrothermal vent metagenome TaxID=652676 RepID=A0A3B0XLT4_9ZZZZ